MPNAAVTPKRLYKYRAFSSKTLDMIVRDKVYFADPRTFNDPLDTSPILKIDVDTSILERALIHLCDLRVDAELRAAAKAINRSGPNIIQQMDHLRQRNIAQMLDDIHYNASNPEYKSDTSALHTLLGQSVGDELLKRYDKGVFSLAARDTCPLMWSHYGDQHRGVCLGYAVSPKMEHKIHRVKYGGSRSVEASLVVSMLDGDAEARAKVDAAILLQKASDWRYEREWRLFGPIGVEDSHLELVEIVFGMRCEFPVIYTVAKAVEERSPQILLSKIFASSENFRLRKRRYDIDEHQPPYPTRRQILDEHFEPVDEREED